MQRVLQGQSEREFLDVGLIIFLQTKGINKDLRYRSSILGWKRGVTIIVEMPLLNGVYVSLATGCECIVRYIYNGTAYGFETVVLKSLNDPNVPLLYLAYPQKVEKIGLRRHQRVEMYLPIHIEIQGESQSQELEGNILDLSVGGCLFEITSQVDFNVKLEAKIIISFSLPNAEQYPIKVQAIVKRIHIISNSTKVGIQFFDLSPEALAKIRNFCEMTPLKE
ncbi:MAG: flagellar brake protein [bacterium]